MECLDMGRRTEIECLEEQCAPCRGLSQPEQFAAETHRLPASFRTVLGGVVPYS